MVTDKGGTMGSSNWTQDYFTTTAGLAFVFQVLNRTVAQLDPIMERNDDVRLALRNDKIRHADRKNMQQEMVEVFERDWNSQFSSVIQPLAE